MRTIREMLGNDEKVWVYINDMDVWEKFAEAAVSEGLCFGELSPENWKFGHAVAVHSSGNMGHLPLMIWCKSFLADFKNTPKRVDFSKYYGKDEDYLCKSSHFTAILDKRI